MAAFADGYREDLARLGFTANSVVTHVVLIGQLIRWMAQSGVMANRLTRSGSRVAVSVAVRPRPAPSAEVHTGA